jgi:hypothetical protein
LLDSLPLLLEMVSVMTKQILLTAIMMAVIAASTSTQITALIAYVIMKKTVLLDSLPLLLGMAPVMRRPTMNTVTMMVETVVSPMQCHEILHFDLYYGSPPCTVSNYTISTSTNFSTG